MLTALLMTACERNACSDVACGENSYCNEKDGLCECKTAYERDPSGSCTIPKRDKFLGEYTLTENEVVQSTGAIVPNTTNTYNIEIQADDQDVSNLIISNLRNAGVITKGQVADNSDISFSFDTQSLGNELALGVYATLDVTSGEILFSYAVKQPNMEDFVYYRGILTPQ